MLEELTNILSGNISEVIDAIGNAADKLFTSDDERNKFKLLFEQIKQHPKDVEIELQKFLIQSDLTDRISARNREIQVKDWTPRFLAISVTLGFFGILFFCMLDNTLAAPYETILKIMIGSLGTAWVTIIAYYFGSSSSSQNKDELMGKYLTRE